jgi:hypothetical protein
MTPETPHLPDDLVTYYRHMLRTHASTPETNGCPVCNVPRCPDWTNAYDKLAAAGQAMNMSPPAWQPFHPRGLKR